MIGKSEHERLPSGKIILRRFEKGALIHEMQTYEGLAIGISFTFSAGTKIEETYFSKKRMVGRRSYEKARLAFPDMPPADESIEDWGQAILGDIRVQQRERKAAEERRLAKSAESKFPRPASTNWLRVIADERSHLLIFTSRDWKVLAREREHVNGRAWLHAFGFSGPPDIQNRVADGPLVGYEVIGNRVTMLKLSRDLLIEVSAFALHLPERPSFNNSIRPRSKPRKVAPFSWPNVLPPLIEFLASLREDTVKIFNHHL